jgi:hypothetical protein
MRLAYSSEAESPVDRSWRKVRKLEARVEENRTGTRYVKPKGMHWSTFNALCDRIAAAEEEKDAAWMVGAARLLGKFARLAGDDPAARALRAELEGLRGGSV